MNGWASIDPATKSGIAGWRYDSDPQASDLVGTVVLRPVGKSGWTMARDGRATGKAGHKPEHIVWREAVTALDVVVVEVGRGASRTADKSLAERRGYIRAICETQGVRYVEVELSTWRRAIADEMCERGEPLTWGVGDDTKPQSLALVTRLYGLSGITSDEADAVLIGRAAMRLRLV